MIKEELPEENAVITFNPSILLKTADMEISLRDQIFSTVHTSDFLLSSQYLKPKGFQSQESDTQNNQKLEANPPQSTR